MTEFEQQDRGFRKRPEILDYLGADGMDEYEARELAHRLIRRAREEEGRAIEGVAPAHERVRRRRESASTVAPDTNLELSARGLLTPVFHPSTL